MAVLNNMLQSLLIAMLLIDLQVPVGLMQKKKSHNSKCKINPYGQDRFEANF